MTYRQTCENNGFMFYIRERCPVCGGAVMVDKFRKSGDSTLQVWITEKKNMYEVRKLSRRIKSGRLDTLDVGLKSIK
jgi:hypothetical protein